MPHETLSTTRIRCPALRGSQEYRKRGLTVEFDSSAIAVGTAPRPSVSLRSATCGHMFGWMLMDAGQAESAILAQMTSCRVCMSVRLSFSIIPRC